MPARAAIAPRRPKKRSPTISDRFTTFGPGSTWPMDSSSVNSVALSQRRRSTSSRWAIGSTPPKPISASRLNAMNKAQGLAGRGAASEGTAGFEGVVSDMRRARHSPGRPQAQGQCGGHPGQGDVV